jgi:hypothetical protein
LPKPDLRFLLLRLFVPVFMICLYSKYIPVINNENARNIPSPVAIIKVIIPVL